ncbi:CD225/dispanin family protein [Rhodococcoides fascians A21d2]|uniref:CD225/dispanin family protein n=1 Tax=Rhodococcoides fascians TaxID=1828 RepID=UPI0006908548|nr:CD225/dispanin family protein [Rhodococcus fascians A21d2]
MSGPYEQPFPAAQSFPAAQPYSQPAALPSSNAGWAVVAIIFFWPLAIPAFNHALKVHPLWMMGDVQEAELFVESGRVLREAVADHLRCLHRSLPCVHRLGRLDHVTGRRRFTAHPRVTEMPPST